MNAAAEPPGERPSPAPIVVLQCATCHAIVSDTLEYYVASDAAQRIITMSDARLITVDTNQLASTTGFDSGCVYQNMSCSTCKAPVGRVYAVTTPQLDHLCNNYTFSTRALISYQLGSIEQAASAAAAVLEQVGGERKWQPQPEMRNGSARLEIDAPPQLESYHPGKPAPSAPRSETPPKTPAEVLEAGAEAGAETTATAPQRPISMTAVGQAVSEIDDFVTKLGVSCNQSAAAQKKHAADIAQIRKDAETQREQMKTLQDESAATIDKMQLVLISWEERVKDVEKRLTAAELQSMARQTLESRFAALGQHLDKAATTLRASSEEPVGAGVEPVGTGVEPVKTDDEPAGLSDVIAENGSGVEGHDGQKGSATKPEEPGPSERPVTDVEIIDVVDCDSLGAPGAANPVSAAKDMPAQPQEDVGPSPASWREHRAASSVEPVMPVASGAVVKEASRNRKKGRGRGRGRAHRRGRGGR